MTASHHPIDVRVAEELATLGDRGGAAAAAQRQAWAEAHPHAPCTRCASKGCYAETIDGTTRRPFDARTFDPTTERYVATCTACRGLGRIPVTPEHAAYLARRDAKRARRAFRRAQAAVCRARGMTPAEFNVAARRRLPAGEPSPVDWAKAATGLAEMFGIDLNEGGS